MGRRVGLETKQMNGVARGFFADVFALGIGEAGESVADVDAAHIGRGALKSVVLVMVVKGNLKSDSMW